VWVCGGGGGGGGGGGILEMKAAVCLLESLVPTCQTAARRRKSRSQYRSPLVGKIHIFYVKVKVNFTPKQSTKAQKGSSGITLLFFNFGAIWGGKSTPLPRPLYPRERPGTHCIGGWVGPRAGLDGCGKSRPHRDSIPGPSSP